MQGIDQPGTQTLTITNDEMLSSTVTLSVSTTSVAEDATGADRTVTVTATLDGEARTEDTDVTVSIAAGTAVEGTDFSAVTPFTITITSGDTSGTGTFTLAPVDDNIDEPNETVIVSGTTASSGVTVEPATGVTLTIEDDEDPPVLSLVLTPESISENGGTSTVTARLSHPSSEAVTVTPTVQDRLQHEGIHFNWNETFVERSLTIAAEQMASTRMATMTAIDNDVDNPDRVLTVGGRSTPARSREG